MSQNIDRLFDLLPSIYRQRDADENGQLKALLRVIAEQVNIVEADIARLYENWFIETCQDWIMPYIGDLIGYQPVHEAGEAVDITSTESRQLTRILSSRREVGNTIAYRRRKGTLSLLAQLAKDMSDWPAYPLEFYRLLGVSQSSNFRHLQRGRVVDIRKHSALEQIGRPFEREAHRVDVRRIDSSMTQGRYNLPSVGLFVWRLKAYSATRITAYCVREGNPSCYTFSVMGNDRPLYNHEQTSTGPENEQNFPGPITRRELREHLTDYYGEGKSIQIWARERLDTGESRERQASSQTEQREPRTMQQSSRHVEHFEEHRHHGHHEHHGHNSEQGPHTGAQQQSPPHEQHSQDAQPPGSSRPPHTAAAQQEPPLQLVTPDRIVAADLSEWAYRPRHDKVAVDPQLGRIIFPLGDQVDDVIVSFYYGFSADIGGGEYNRPTLRPSRYKLFQVGKKLEATQGFTTVQKALDAWQDWKVSNPLPHHGVIEIVDNGVYTEQLNISLEQDERLEICAANRQRPVIRLIEWKEDRPDYLKVSGGSGSHFTLDGLLITGGVVQVREEVMGVHLRHCTLVPGKSIHHDCEPRSPGEPSLELFHAGECVTIEHSIVGTILVHENADREDPIRMTISDCILDATGIKRDALCQPDNRIAYVDLTVLRSTILGCVRVHSIALAENSIFTSELTIARRQAGCMRFCSINPESRAPRRFHCQPDLAREAARNEVQGVADQQAKAAYIRRAVDRVRPVFNSTRYGRPDYCQLAFACAPEITQGADDESELGVFHDLYQPQREANLRARLDEFTPASMDTGIIFVS
jgi:hypothetical protein